MEDGFIFIFICRQFLIIIIISKCMEKLWAAKMCREAQRVRWAYAG